MKTATDTLTATQARHFATRILTECSQCFSNVKVVKDFGKWVIKLDGGSEACYGRTLRDEDDCQYTLDVFKND